MPIRKIAGLAACAATCLAAGLLPACGGGGSSGSASPQSPQAAEALRPAQTGELVAYFRERLAKQDRYPSWVWMDGPLMVAEAAGAGGAEAVPLSGTNLQVAGVDEDDLLKSDGSFVYSLNPYPPRLDARRIQPGGSLGSPASIALDLQVNPSGMYLAEEAKRIAVLGRRQSQVSLHVLDVADGAQPVPVTQVRIDGALVSTRRIANVLYVATTWMPDLSPYWWQPGMTDAQLDAKLAGLTAGALLPRIQVGDGAAMPLVEEEDCHLQSANASPSLQLTTITAIDLSSPSLERRSTCFVGSGQSLYMAPTAAYVTTSRNYSFGFVQMPAQSTTDVHKFALQGLQVAYRGSAEVAGHLGWDREKMPYRMSEHEGNLRIVTFTGQTGWVGPVPASGVPQTPASPATLTVLREDAGAGRLVRVATLPNAQRPAPLGHAGEQVYAVQFAGPLAYIVTFRLTDPLYVLDLSNPADPKTVGELSAPGFSDFLFPLPDGKLLGIGKDADDQGFRQGMKVALFDVGDPSHPALLSSRSLGARGTFSALDFSRHGINIFQSGARARIALPVRVMEEVDGIAQVTRKGLARYVVDTAAGTLDERAMVSTENLYDVPNERSIQSAAATYYLTGGQVMYIPEP